MKDEHLHEHDTIEIALYKMQTNSGSLLPVIRLLALLTYDNFLNLYPLVR